MEMITVMVAGLFAALFAGAVRSLIADTDRHRTLIACGVMTGFFAPLLAISGRSLGLSAAADVCVLALGIAITLGFSSWHKQNLRRMVALAPSVREFGLSNFNWLDGDGNGLIARADLSLARERKMLSPVERQMVVYFGLHLGNIGHVTDSMMSVFPMSPSVVVIEEHAINRGDLEGYPDKVRAEYERQYGSL